MKRAVSLLAVVVLTIFALPSHPAAHDIPEDTTVRMFVKPEGPHLHVLARVQMASINDIDWPTHKTGYLDIAQVDQFLRDASTMWISDYMDVYENGRKLGFPDVVSVRLVPDGDLSFEETYAVAEAHMAGEKIPESTNLFPTQGLLDVMFDYKVTSENSSFAINPRFDRLGLRVTTNLKFLRPNGAVREFEYVGLPGLVRLDPQWNQAVWQFMQLGFFHLLDASGPLLFLLCLVLPYFSSRSSGSPGRVRGIVPVAAAFAVAHTLTFIASALYGMAPDTLWFEPFITTMIAVSIFYVAIENIITPRLDRRWIVALAFGLAHGFAFSFALRGMLQFAGAHPTASIISFNIGIELAILLVLALMVPALELLFRFVVDERMGTIVISAIVAHTAWHWMTERYATFRRYPLKWPALDLSLLASVLRWLMAGVILAAVVWLIGIWRQSKDDRDPERVAPQESTRVPPQEASRHTAAN